jgi:hypothetical protein
VTDPKDPKFVLPTSDGLFMHRGDDGGWSLTISFSPKTYERIHKDPKFAEFILAFMALFHIELAPKGGKAS